MDTTDVGEIPESIRNTAELSDGDAAWDILSLEATARDLIELAVWESAEMEIEQEREAVEDIPYPIPEG